MTPSRDPSAIPPGPAAPTPFRANPGGRPHEVLLDGHAAVVTSAGRATPTHWSLRHVDAAWHLRPVSPDAGAPEALAVVEAVLSGRPDVASLVLHVSAESAAQLRATGGVMDTAAGLVATREMVWQLPTLFLPGVRDPIALHYTMTDGRRHPLRPAKQTGTVYRRFIPWLDQTFSFRALDPAQDLDRFHRWMNDPEVARFWQEAGDLDQHRAYLARIAADPHMTSLIACIDDTPFAYFEVYWAKENRIAPFYDVGDHDRGWHVLVGESAFRGKRYATAWLTSVSHYLFLDDPRTQRVVGEPAANHVQQIRNLDRSGFAKVKEFDFPHKRALLISMLRERYFADRLWLPREDPQPATPTVAPEAP